jgi:hypothetical protein
MNPAVMAEAATTYGSPSGALLPVASLSQAGIAPR